MSVINKHDSDSEAAEQWKQDGCFEGLPYNVYTDLKS